jgi:hypothetical protein
MADSLSLRRFLNYGMDEATPDHVTISRTRRLIDEKTHQAVFTFLLGEVAKRGLLKEDDRNRRDEFGSECSDEVDRPTRHGRELHGISAAVGAGSRRRSQ